MKSINFEFIRPHQPELATLGGFAERYSHNDPDAALVKLRNFAEEFVKDLYVKLRLPAPMQANLYDLTREVSFKNAVPQVVLNKLDSLRIQGNKAAHGDKLSTTIALWILREAWDLTAWLFVAHCGGARDQLPVYQEPVTLAQTVSNEEQARKEKKLVLEQLAAQENQLAQLLAELEQERAKAQTAERTIEELNAALTSGQQVAAALQFDEAATRQRLIDAALVDAGWKVGPQGNSTEQVGQEVEVLHQQLPSGKGYADYVLWGDNGKPLAVIEAKKTSVDANDGREQARRYAEGLERQFRQRPVIFYTNGFETFIWNDAVNETPRQIHGFYSKDSLEYLIFQRDHRQPLAQVAPDPNIAGRIYQIETIRRVTERLTAGHRKGLIVLATGTGKTRVAVSLCQLLLRAGWVKRVLFLCDRRELRKQADNVFKEHLPSEPRVAVNANTAQDRDKRIYLATYPAMMKIFDTFDVGFFDLIIADESHRSIYRRYRDLFLYFDCLQIGLTATPVHLVGRNTYRLFGCEDRDPTAHFSYEDATEHKPKYLVPFNVFKTTTQFQREGIRYSQMTEEQRQELEESEGEPEAIEYDVAQIDRQIFNKDSNRAILRNLMENGIRDESGSRPGKSIIFARNHNHALLLQKLFYEMYPQYGGHFCRVIDNYDPRAEQLIDDFKGTGNTSGLTIAISVDMLDTGIDIPEVVNLVFAKPVKSYVKFWQMIGRGTRLCPNLFGPGKDKTEFFIFDHWQNFEFFEERYKEANQAPVKSLLQRLFEARIELAETALNAQDSVSFDAAIELIARDVADLPDESLPVREKMREVLTARHDGSLKAFAPTTVAMLKTDIAPLMQWRDLKGADAAYKFDLLATRLQTEKLRGSASFDNLKNDLINDVRQLPINLNQVRAKEELISQVKSEAFWQSAGVPEIERLRREMRGLMRFITTTSLPKAPPKVIDVTEDHRLMVEVLDPKPTEVIGDPACGTAGFLVETMLYLQRKYTSPELVFTDEQGTHYPADLLESYREHIQNEMFYGFDFDVTMLRIAEMNMMLHGIDRPNIRYQDALSNNFLEHRAALASNCFDVILANPPFTGSLDEKDISPTLTGKVKTKKTELLFLALILRMLKTGGRSATIVPDGVLFGSSKAHLALRKMLVEENQLEAVISLPSGVFKPYAGVSTAIVVFTKGGATSEVFFYDVQADGFSLDDKRTPLDLSKRETNNLPDVLARWRNLKAEKKRKRTDQSFLALKADIVANNYDLSVNRYKEVVYEEADYDAPSVILSELAAMERDIQLGIEELQGMLRV